MSRRKVKPPSPGPAIQSESTPYTSKELLALGLIVVIYFLMRWPFRNVGLVRDEGEYAYLGQEILRGSVPYRDVYNQKTPFVFYFFAVVEALCGQGVPTIRIATTLYGVATTIVLYGVARMLLGWRAAIATAVAFAVMTFDQCGIIYPSSTEYFLLLWMSVCLWFGYRGRQKQNKWLLFGAGLAAGMGYFTKQLGAVLILFLLADSLWNESCKPRHERGWLRPSLEIAFCLLGFSFVQAIALAYFAWQGAMPAYLECTWWNNFAYVGQRHQSLIGSLTILGRAIDSVAHWDMFLWLWGGSALALFAYFGRRSRGSGLWILLLGTTAAAVLAGRRYLQYYQPMIVPLALGNGLALAWFWQWAMERNRARWQRALVFIIAVIPWLWPAENIIASLARADRDVIAEERPQFMYIPDVVRYIEARTEPGEKILVLGSEPEIYYLSGRPACTRLVITYPLTGPYPYAERLLDELLADFKRCQPRYVVYCRDVFSRSESGWSINRFDEPVKQILERSYKGEALLPVGQVPEFLVFRRRDNP